MRGIDRIIEEYRQGDFEHRLNLFLEHRPLRTMFVDIDLDEASVEISAAAEPTVAGPVATASNQRKTVFNPCKRLLQWCHRVS